MVFQCIQRNRKLMNLIDESHWYLEIIGSGANGLYTHGGDLDLMFYADGTLEMDPVELLKIMRNGLRSLSATNDIEGIFTARVPILQFVVAETGVEVDISVNNWAGVANSRLMLQCNTLD